MKRISFCPFFGAKDRSASPTAPPIAGAKMGAAARPKCTRLGAAACAESFSFAGIGNLNFNNEQDGIYCRIAGAGLAGGVF